ncbi:hypothetical protein BC941DRAFT_471186 [Chlamydoabsidia padenii]|nr:hypothetical protein BC941DRAFT_471186 [Chlamydoabsidia padenii]
MEPLVQIQTKPYHVYEIFGFKDKSTFEGTTLTNLCVMYYVILERHNPETVYPPTCDVKRYCDKMIDAINVSFLILRNADYKAEYDRDGIVNIRHFFGTLGVNGEDEFRCYCKGMSHSILSILDLLKTNEQQSSKTINSDFSSSLTSETINSGFSSSLTSETINSGFSFSSGINSPFGFVQKEQASSLKRQHSGHLDSFAKRSRG